MSCNETSARLISKHARSERRRVCEKIPRTYLQKFVLYLQTVFLRGRAAVCYLGNHNPASEWITTSDLIMKIKERFRVRYSHRTKTHSPEVGMLVSGFWHVRALEQSLQWTRATGGCSKFQTDKSAAIYFITLASSRVYEYILSMATQKRKQRVVELKGGFPRGLTHSPALKRARLMQQRKTR